MKTVSLDLMDFIEKNILPRYNEFDKAHNLFHVQQVIKNSLILADIVGADRDMSYAIAAYHDLGLSGPRAIHHITSGKILQSDSRLRKWFSQDKIKIMKEAVEDHRASASRSPRSIYGKIVAEADRDLEADHVFRRAIQFGLEKYPEKDITEYWNRFYKHMIEKYSSQGYIHLWIQNSPNEKKLKEVRDIINQPVLLKQYFERIYKEETLV